ncbi:hypothetical protein LBMAG49_11280 [Planctomycetota bacterium]|jgi:hypothetical protein|nr:hypothetical protein LBMAG49_11280 [Planctomycetota bacterium]
MIKLQLAPDARMLRQFGWAALVAFPLIALVFRWRFGLPDNWAYGIGAMGPIVCLTELAGVHAVARQVFRALVLLTFPIGFLLFPVLIGAIYYCVFTPFGWTMRLFGRDVMNRRPDPKLSSYWHVRGAPRPKSSYLKLY